MDYGIAVLSRVIKLVVLGNNDARESTTILKSSAIYILHRFGDADVC